MKYEGLKILFYENYIDTKNVKEAIYSDKQTVEAFPCDTDILCFPELCKSIFISSMNLSILYP